MSATVDERVVSMQFDNKNFESNVATTMSTLDKLKRSLNLDGASKGLENVNAAANNCNMSPLERGVESVKAKFSALQVMGATALANITNSAVNAGKRIAAALTIEPIKMGFQEYETQINAVQTILANTKSKGTTLDQVNNALDELNLYADKTIYNFTEMTRNIGTFTAAGIDLDTSVNAIQGIANLAAVSGSNSQQASTAMYQLSQALATGTVKLMDWNSVVNAGMGGQVFQDALKQTSKELGTGAEAAIKAKGSFRESLQTGWLTSEVLTETLKKFTTSGANEYVAEYTGLSAKAVQAALDSAEAQYGEADAIDKAAEALAKKSGKNKDEIKQALDFAKTAEDAATKVKTFSQLIDTLKEAMQSGWTQSWEIIIGDFEEAKELFTGISDTLGEMINDSAEARNKVLQGWKDLGGRTALIDGFKNIFEGILSIVKPIKEAFRDIFPPLTANQLLTFTENFRDLTAKLKINDEVADKLKRTFKGVFSILDIGKKVITTLLKPLFELANSKGISGLGDLILSITAAIGDFFTKINEGFDTNGISGGLSKIVSGISNVISSAVNGLKGFGKILSSIGGWVAKVAGNIWNSIKEVFTWITDNVSAGDIFAGLAGGGIFAAAKKFIGLIDKIKDTIDGLFNKKYIVGSIKDKFTDILDSLHGSLESFTTGIKVSSLVSIAIAIGILSNSIRTLSKLKVTDIGKSLGAIGAMLAMLSSEFKSMSKTLSKFDSKGIVKSSFALILVAAAIKILADALVKISELTFAEILNGLFGIGGGLIALSVGLKIIDKTKISLKTSVAILALAQACKMLGDAMSKFAGFSWDEIGIGLVAMGGALLELTGVLAIMNKVCGGKSLLGSVSLLIAVHALDELAVALKSFGEMSWDAIGRGLTSMGGALVELGVVIGLLGKLAGFSGILGAVSILIVVKSLDDLAVALKSFGSMSWEEIARGLSGMGGALTEVSLACGILGKIAGFSGILGAGSILIVTQCLDEMAAALQQFGSMSWEEIARGLVAMGGALLEVSGISGALGALAGLAGIIGSGSILIAVQGLGDIADALKKFGEMSWDEIGRGLTAMGAALGEIAVGGLLNTLSGLGSMSISNISEPLGTLADSVKKWTGVVVPENLGLQLGLLADGIMSFTFGGMGSSSIAEVAAPLGVLADSVKKWTGVTVPEGFCDNLKVLASGIRSFVFTGMGSSSIAEVATPLGALADSVKKWSGVTVSEGLATSLLTLANCIKQFTWTFMSGFSINSLIKPLGELPDSIKKWNGIKIPANLETGLESISEGVKGFTWLFMGGWSMSTITTPLGDLAGSIKKWNGVKIPGNIEDGLISISNGVKSFTWAFAGGWSISSIAEPLKTLATAAQKLSAAKIPKDIGDRLTSLASGVKSFVGIGSISGVSKNIGSIASSASKLSGINFKSINSGLTSFVSTVKKVGNVSINTESLTKSVSSVTSSIRKMMKTMSSTIRSGKSSISSAMKTAMSGMPTTVKSYTGKVKAVISNLLKVFIKVILDKKSDTTSAFKKLVSNASDAIKSKRSSIKSAGKDLGAGLVEGINSKQTAVYNAAYKLGQKAVQGEKDGQKSNSPSKLTIQAGKWFGEGLVIGIDKMGRAVYNAGYGIGDTAVKSISKSIANISDIINSDVDYQPTIRPVLDLSDVTSGAQTVNSLFSMQPSVGILSNIGSINSMMNRRNQNGGNADVIDAINKLRKDVGNIETSSYTIGGITYDDGSAVSEAVRSLVDAARIERRM